ncbi:MAG: DUF2283 domain-containing protein [Leptospiraceae bacterium]|nr:DUF2283 domain-containing protein [Leptospiraceae bacterium]MCK6381846.1 DUF2283 domain-containing protein [Leptospiraceae bacterium]NUM42923.1 DUF2283 domain-containing protein [Leptospiraceae bacterium]
MKIKYYKETDTLYLELSDISKRAETVEIFDGSDVFAEKSESGKILALTIESASEKMDLKDLEMESVPFEHMVMNKLVLV